MSAEFLADESVDSRIVNHLHKNDVSILSIRETDHGSSDKRVLQISRQLDRILITEDSDFGEWVFAHQEKTVGVIFLRYRHDEIQQIATVITEFIQSRGESLRGKFVTITPKKVRIRDL